MGFNDGFEYGSPPASPVPGGPLALAPPAPTLLEGLSSPAPDVVYAAPAPSPAPASVPVVAEADQVVDVEQVAFEDLFDFPSVELVPLSDSFGLKIFDAKLRFAVLASLFQPFWRNL